jgi:hypothetical protein
MSGISTPELRGTNFNFNAREPVVDTDAGKSVAELREAASADEEEARGHMREATRQVALADECIKRQYARLALAQVREAEQKPAEPQE